MDYFASLVTDPAAWVALATLVVMEVVLYLYLDPHEQAARGASRAHAAARHRARAGDAPRPLGTVALIVRLTTPIFEAFGHVFSWRDLILIAGGAFLVWKATTEIHHHVAHDPDAGKDDKAGGSLTPLSAIGQISIMFVAVIAAVAVMMFAAGPLSRFIERNPTIVMLALGFLPVIGMTLIAEGFGTHVPKCYIYVAMVFSALVEALNMLAAARRKAHRPSRTTVPAACCWEFRARRQARVAFAASARWPRPHAAARHRRAPCPLRCRATSRDSFGSRSPSRAAR